MVCKQAQIVTLQFIARGSRAAPILRREDVRNVLRGFCDVCEGQALASVQLSEAGWPGLSGFAGWGRSGIRPKGLEDLNVYRDSRKQDDKVR